MKKVLSVLLTLAMVLGMVGMASAEGDVVTLKWVTVGSSMPTNYDAWLAQINPYLEEKIGVNIEMDVIGWGDWDQRRNVIVNTNEPYDIIFGNMNTYNNDVQLGAYLATTLEALTPILTELKDKSNSAVFPLNKNGATWLMTFYDGMNAGLGTLGVRYDDAEGKVVSVLEQDDVMANLKILHEWYNAGLINADAATLPEDNKYKVCSVAQGWPSAAITTWGPNMGVNAVAYQWGETVVSNDTVRGSLNSISVNCEHPEKALAFLQLINTDSYVRDLFYYGVEGDNWQYTDDTKTAVHKNNADWPMAGYTQATFFNVTPTDDVDFNQWDEVKALNEAAKPSVLLGFYFDTSSVQDQLAACIEIYNRYKGEVLTGTTDPTVSVPQMMEEMRAAGFDEIVAEAQTQVDAFLGK